METYDYNLFARVCATHNVYPSTVADEVNCPRSSISRWKKSFLLGKPGGISHTNLSKLASYFDLDADYFLSLPKEKQPTSMIELAARDNGMRISSFYPDETKKESTSISESELIEGSAKQKLIDLILNDDISEDQAQAWITLIESVKNNRLN